jgi:glycerophosphoryl diester phosphodiesterase
MRAISRARAAARALASVALAAAALAALAGGCARRAPAPVSVRPAAMFPTPIVIAHRGASGHRPEHTLAAYALAVAMGADFIEPDLVITKDGVLVARHENEIGGTTDVAERFPDRRRTAVIDGTPVTGWFTEDFTLAELRTLRARERLAFRSHAHDGEEAIPTFDEVLALADALGRQRGRPVGVYPETKHPTHFRGIGLPLEPPLLAALRARGLDRADAPVFIQSFEVGNLQALRRQTRVPLVLLLAGGEAPYDRQLLGDRRTGAEWVTPAGLREVAAFADAVGVHTRMLVGGAPDAAPTALVRDAHAAGLMVHAWTLRPEAAFLAPRYRGDPLAEVRELAALGVDGLFGDYPDQLVQGLGRTP